MSRVYTKTEKATASYEQRRAKGIKRSLVIMSMRKAGCSFAFIAKHLGVSRARMSQIKKQHGIV